MARLEAYSSIRRTRRTSSTRLVATAVLFPIQCASRPWIETNAGPDRIRRRRSIVDPNNRLADVVDEREVEAHLPVVEYDNRPFFEHRAREDEDRNAWTFRRDTVREESNSRRRRWLAMRAINCNDFSAAAHGDSA